MSKESKEKDKEKEVLRSLCSKMTLPGDGVIEHRKVDKVFRAIRQDIISQRMRTIAKKPGDKMVIVDQMRNTIDNMEDLSIDIGKKRKTDAMLGCVYDAIRFLH